MLKFLYVIVFDRRISCPSIVVNSQHLYLCLGPICMLIDSLASSDMSSHASSASLTCNKSRSADIEGANNTISSAYRNILIQYHSILHPSGRLYARENTLSMYTANRYGDNNTPPCLTPQGRQRAHEKHEYHLTHVEPIASLCINLTNSPWWFILSNALQRSKAQMLTVEPRLMHRPHSRQHVLVNRLHVHRLISLPNWLLLVTKHLAYCSRIQCSNTFDITGLIDIPRKSLTVTVLLYSTYWRYLSELGPYTTDQTWPELQILAAARRFVLRWYLTQFDLHLCQFSDLSLPTNDGVNLSCLWCLVFYNGTISAVFRSSSYSTMIYQPSDDPTGCRRPPRDTVAAPPRAACSLQSHRHCARAGGTEKGRMRALMALRSTLDLLAHKRRADWRLCVWATGSALSRRVNRCVRGGSIERVTSSYIQQPVQQPAEQCSYYWWLCWTVWASKRAVLCTDK